MCSNKTLKNLLCILSISRISSLHKTRFTLTETEQAVERCLHLIWAPDALRCEAKAPSRAGEMEWDCCKWEAAGEIILSVDHGGYRRRMLSSDWRGKWKRPESAGEVHTLKFEAAEGHLKREWRQRGLIKMKRKSRNEQWRSVLTELQDEMYRKRHRGTFLFKLADNTVIQSDFLHWSLYYIYSTNLFKKIK